MVRVVEGMGLQIPQGNLNVGSNPIVYSNSSVRVVYGRRREDVLVQYLYLVGSNPTYCYGVMV